MSFAIIYCYLRTFQNIALQVPCLLNDLWSSSGGRQELINYLSYFSHNLYQNWYVSCAEEEKYDLNVISFPSTSLYSVCI